MGLPDSFREGKGSIGELGLESICAISVFEVPSEENGDIEWSSANVDGGLNGRQCGNCPDCCRRGFMTFDWAV